MANFPGLSTYIVTRSITRHQLQAVGDLWTCVIQCDHCGGVIRWPWTTMSFS